MTYQHKLFKSLFGVGIGTAILLTIPFLAMLFTNEVNWTLFDFVIAGVLLFGTGTAYVLLTYRSRQLLYRIATGLASLSTLFLIWANLAVGIIGNEDEIINLLYFGVVMIGLAGIFISNLKADGLARTLFAMAMAHIMITLFALLTGWQHVPGSSAMEIIGVNALFIALFGLAGILYHNVDSQN